MNKKYSKWTCKVSISTHNEDKNAKIQSTQCNFILFILLLIVKHLGIRGRLLRGLLTASSFLLNRIWKNKNILIYSPNTKLFQMQILHPGFAAQCWNRTLYTSKCYHGNSDSEEKHAEVRKFLPTSRAPFQTHWDKQGQSAALSELSVRTLQTSGQNWKTASGKACNLF